MYCLMVLILLSRTYTIMWVEYILFATALYYLLGTILVPCQIRDGLFMTLSVYCLFITFWLPIVLVKIVDRFFLQGRIRERMQELHNRRDEDQDENTE